EQAGGADEAHLVGELGDRSFLGDGDVVHGDPSGAIPRGPLRSPQATGRASSGAPRAPKKLTPATGSGHIILRLRKRQLWAPGAILGWVFVGGQSKVGVTGRSAIHGKGYS